MFPRISTVPQSASDRSSIVTSDEVEEKIRQKQEQRSSRDALRRKHIGYQDSWIHGAEEEDEALGTEHPLSPSNKCMTSLRPPLKSCREENIRHYERAVEA
jgi:hypothetical protein